MSGEQLSDANTPPLVYERLVLRLENRQKELGVQELRSPGAKKKNSSAAKARVVEQAHTATEVVASRVRGVYKDFDAIQFTSFISGG
jgi:hypothetical protein